MPTTPSSTRAPRACAALVLLLGALAAPAAAQTSWHPVIAAGPADARAGAVGHLGVRVIPRSHPWLHLRADGTAGRLAGRSASAGTLALELGTREAPQRPVRLFALLGGSVVRRGPASDGGLMAGAGARVRVGRAWLSAEQRFQAGFSPFLVGLGL
jgi:hypothetical protein